jgi:hypothetical protein
MTRPSTNGKRRLGPLPGSGEMSVDAASFEVDPRLPASTQAPFMSGEDHDAPRWA